MGRKKKVLEEEPFKYCAAMTVRCENTNCARHYKNAPYDELITVSHRWKPNPKTGTCNGFMEEII